MQHFGKAALRVTKNYTKGYSDTQAKVRDATSNDAWGPSGTVMNEIAQLTYNQGDFVEIMEMLDKRLNDKGKNWRHVFKSLTVLDYCLHQGSENVVIYFRDNAYIIKTLKEFQYIDEDGKDQGANVRQKAKDITNLLQDESRLRQERRTRASMRERMIRGGAGGGTGDDDYEPPPMDENHRRRNGGPKPNRDEDDLRKAIEESKKSMRDDQITAEERDLIEALKLSEEEEAKRAKAVQDSNSSALFDDQNQLASPSSQFSNNPFPMANFSDPTPYTVGLQPQHTVQPQFTGFPGQQLQPQFTQLQPQFTSFNPYQQQAEQEAAQAEFMRQQQAFLQQQQAAQAQQQNEEWMRQQMMLQQQQQQEEQQRQQQQMYAQQSLVPQPTGFGSNNPFAPAQSPPPLPTQNTLNPPSFNLQGTYTNHNADNVHNLGQSSPSPGPSQRPASQNTNQHRPIQVKPRKDEDERLASLFANRDDGQDTFGNTGALRYGHGAGARIIAQPTSNQNQHNPFAIKQPQQQSSEQPFFSI